VVGSVRGRSRGSLPPGRGRGYRGRWPGLRGHGDAGWSISLPWPPGVARS